MNTTNRLSLYQSYHHALSACDGRFVGASLTWRGYAIQSVVGDITVIGLGSTYEEALEASIWQLDRMTTLWDADADEERRDMLARILIASARVEAKRLWGPRTMEMAS